MVDDAKLQKLTLGPDWIDLSYGEPRVVLQSLMRQLNRFGDPFKMPNIWDLASWEYPPAAGKADLVSILEAKYQSKVVICNGAKQALAAAIHAFAKSGIKSIYYDKPYYPANPGFIATSGMRYESKGRADSYLITTPNNPDGLNYTNEELIGFSSFSPMIHDAAYYTPIYLPKEQVPIKVGDIQIYSMSKMYGVSGLRVGYAVVHNENYYDAIADYVETYTAGVSVASQDVVRNIELFLQENPRFREQFELEAREAIANSRAELKQLDPDIMIPVESAANSMFAWCKAGPALNSVAAKVYILDGKLFGQPGMIRMNIAHPQEVIREAVQRLNDNKK